MTSRSAGLLSASILVTVALGVSPASATVATAGSRSQLTAPGPHPVVVVVLHGLSYADASSIAEVRDLATRAGTVSNPSGAALLVPQGSVEEQVRRIEARADAATPQVNVLHVRGPVARARPVLAEALDGGPLPGGFAFVVGVEPSPGMRATKDGVLPLFAGPTEGPALGPPRALTSDATRRSGVVSSLDLAPSVFAAAGIAASGPGSRIRGTDAPAPDALYERYLQMRRLTVPIQAAAWIWALVAGLLLAVLASVRARRPQRITDAVAGRARWLALSIVPLAVAMLAAGHLPSLTYGLVVPFLVAITLAGTGVLIPLARRGPLAPIAALGGAVLGLFVIETALGWTAALTPLLGGSQLDGGRFYGMPNVAIGIVIGGVVYAVARAGPGTAAAVFAIAIALMGLPWAGANVGAAIAGSAALGVWLAQRRRGSLDLSGLLLALAITVVGAIAILAIHRFVPGAPTHGARFVEGGLGDPVGVALDRLRVGVDLLVSSPAAVIPVVGIVVLGIVGIRPSRSVAPAFQAEPALRELVLTLVLSGIVAYVVEDSGAGASGMFFALGVAALLHVSLPLADRQDRATR